MELAPFSIKLAYQRRVTPLRLFKNVPIRVVGIWFLIAFVVMDLPLHSTSFSIILGRPWLKVAAVMHDWKNNTLILQSRDGVVKMHLRDGKTKPTVPRGSEPSSSASTASDETLVPSNLSSYLVMN